MDAPRRERRHHHHHHHSRKAGAAPGAGKNNAAASYGDVFGGPPRFAAPFGAAPVDYAEVFGGVAATCSIPYLDLPPVAAVGADGGFFGRAGAGDYGEIFGRFDFGDFAVPYEELFGGGAGEEEEKKRRGIAAAEEIASSSWSSSSSTKNESSQLDVESFVLPQHFKEHESSVISFPPDSPQFVMSYNKTTQCRTDDLVEMPTRTADPSVGYVVGLCNFSHVPSTNPVSRVDNGKTADGEQWTKYTPSSTSISVMNHESDVTVDQKQHIPACLPISRNICVNENHQISNSNSVPINGTPSPDYAFLRVSDINMQTQPVKVAPSPLRQQPKLLKKRDTVAKGDARLENHSHTPTSSAHATSSSSTSQDERKADTSVSNTEANPSSAAAAMKEAMEYAEARLRAAKELLERKGDSFKLRKKPSHHRSTRSTEIKIPIEADTFDEKFSARNPIKEEKNWEDSLLYKHQKACSVRLDHCDSGKTVLTLERPQQMMECSPEPSQTSSKLEKLGSWSSSDDFYELPTDVRKHKTATATLKEDNCEITNPVSKLSKDKEGVTEVTASDSELERFEKLWEVNDGMDAGVNHGSLQEGNTTPVEKDSVSAVLKASIENVGHREFHSSHFERLATVGNSKESCDDDDRNVELPSTSEISLESDLIKDMPNSSLEACSFGKHAKDLGNNSTKEILVAGMSQEPRNSEGKLEAACDDDMQCTPGSVEMLQEPPQVANVDNSRSSQIKSLILEELEGSYATQTFPRDLGTAGPEAETYGREKFSFIDESFSHNENKKLTELPLEAVISEEENFATEETIASCENSEESILDKDAECPILPSHEESTMLNVFEVASKLIKRDLDQEMEGTIGTGEVETRTEGPDGLVSDNKDKEAEENPSEYSEKTGIEEGSAHGNQDDRVDTEIDTGKGQSDVNVQGNMTVGAMGNVICSIDEAIVKAANSCATRGPTNSIDEPASLSEDGGPAISQTSNTSVPGLGKTEDTCKEAEIILPTERHASFEEENSGVYKTEEIYSRERIPKTELKQQQSHLEKASSLPKSAEGAIPFSADMLKREVPGVQRTKERGSIAKTERERANDKEASRRLEETKEREKRSEKENAEEKERKRLEEQEREREREKDRLAVERATREAHERAFNEARERAEKMALERVTAARQRASAEAREKEERASAEAAARIKLERAAVERATAEARERAIEKAKAEKAAADVRERRERYRSSLKDNRQDTQFHRATSSNITRNPDSYSKGVEIESALRHKARLERHQRTAERVTKALAEKNMRDVLAQREQMEKHRLSEFLDPEIKRWSNGKEGNLRALLSTLQYILGSDSGWQSVPLTDLITAAAVKKAYRKATLCVHPDKLQQRGATIRQKYICEKVFDLLKDAWNKFTSEER